MKLHFNTLYIVCRKSVEKIDLSHHITFFHGKVSSGKSTIARLINFCLGGRIEKTPAINKEFISAKLEMQIGKFDVILDRDKESNDIIVSWLDQDSKEQFRLYAPTQAGSHAIFQETVFCLSDLLLYFWDMSVLKVTTNNSSDALLHRLSIRNFFWYCYLKQEKMDSSFFKFDEPFYSRTTRQTIRFILGFVNQQLVELESGLAKIRENKGAKKGTIEELSSFLDKFHISEKDIENELSEIKLELKNAENSRDDIIENYKSETHSSDQKRQELIRIGNSISCAMKTEANLNNKISQLDSLRLEFISTLYKIDRTINSNNIFSNQVYQSCPCCGEMIKHEERKDTCPLCKEIKHKSGNDTQTFIMARKDSEARIKDIEYSIENHTEELKSIRLTLKKLIKTKESLDAALCEELKIYESSYVSKIRNLDQQIASLRERIRNLLKTKSLPAEITRLQEELAKVEKQEAKILAGIESESARIKNADIFVKDLETEFCNTLKIIGVPGVMPNDSVQISRSNWSVKIIPNDNSDIEWGFFEAGSGGKKTLLNVCFLISIHIVAERHMLDLPSFMIIDTPMKNIDKEVNADLFKNFYGYLFEISETLLKNTQIILIDNAVVLPTNNDVDFHDRYMTPDDPQNPPLISYYMGS